MGIYIVRLKFLGPVHSGHDEAGIGVESVLPFFHSDTIFSAFCNAWADMPDKNNVLSQIREGSVPAYFSSAFLYKFEKGKYTYFLPRPFMPLPNNFGFMSKVIKNLDFITLEQFIKWSKGIINNENNAQTALIGSDIYNYNDLYFSQVRPRQNTDRQTSAASIFHCGEIFFKSKGDLESGLYFIAFTSNEKILHSSLELLQYYGFGGIRSNGYGKFSYEIEDLSNSKNSFNKLFSAQGNAFCLLSLYYPRKPIGVSNKCVAYKTILRKGWFYSSHYSTSLKRASCRMFAEGSIFKGKPQGKILDVAPGIFKFHPVYRCGLAVSVPMVLPVECTQHIKG